MKKFLIYLFLTLSPLVVLYPIDFLYSQIAMRSNHKPIEAWYDLMHGKIDSDVVIMGSSRAYRHIDPSVIDTILSVNSYNLGLSSGWINWQIRKYNLYRKYNPKPSLIIQTIDFYTLGYIMGVEKEQFMPYFWNIPMRKEIITYEPFSKWEKLLPLYRYRGYNLFLSSTPRTLTKGFKSEDLSWQGEALAQKDSISINHNDVSAKMFDEYLSQANFEGIKVLFVYTPLFIEATKIIKNLDEMYLMFQSYADKYDIPILDYTYMGICYDTTYFYNATHLNKLGAEIFSVNLANDIKKMGIIDEVK